MLYGALFSLPGRSSTLRANRNKLVPVCWQRRRPSLGFQIGDVGVTGRTATAEFDERTVVSLSARSIVFDAVAKLISGRIALREGGIWPGTVRGRARFCEGTPNVRGADRLD
jgi:hypothetical protein